jgi:branched-chain amino acid transport system substrate-binding protein
MLDDVNSKGGIGGRQVELYFEDDQSSPTNAAIAATKLIKDKKVLILVGTSIVDSAMAVVPVCEQEKVPFINSGPALIPFKKWIFSVGPGAIRSAGHMLEFAVKDLGGKRIALLHGSDGDGRLGAKAITNDISKYPGTSIVITETFEPADTNMVPQMTKIKAANPDVIVLYTTAGAASVIAKNYKQLGMTVPVVGFAGITAPEFAKNTGKIAEETKWICLTVPITLAEKMAPDDPYRRDVYEPIKKLMQEKYGPTKRVTLYHGSSHDALKASIEAMKAAKEMDSASIRDALEKIRVEGFVGEFACTSTDHQGAPVDPMRPAVLRDGMWVPYVK